MPAECSGVILYLSPDIALTILFPSWRASAWLYLHLKEYANSQKVLWNWYVDTNTSSYRIVPDQKHARFYWVNAIVECLKFSFWYALQLKSFALELPPVSVGEYRESNAKWCQQNKWLGVRRAATRTTLRLFISTAPVRTAQAVFLKDDVDEKLKCTFSTCASVQGNTNAWGAVA